MFRALVGISFRSHATYRSRVWANIFAELVQAAARVAIWQALFAGSANVAVTQIDLRSMITYSVLAGSVLSIWYPSILITSVGRALRTGDLASTLQKPIAYVPYLFAIEFGTLAYLLLTTALPVAVILSFANQFNPPASGAYLILFLAFWAVSFCMLFCVALLFGLLAFWLVNSFALDWALRSMMTLLTGMMVPFWYFPGVLRNIALEQPLAWIAYYPAAVYLGRLSEWDSAAQLAVGVLWLLALLGADLLLLRTAARRLAIQGG